MSRTAEEIGRTEIGPRPLPPLGEQRAATNLSVVDTVLDNGLRVIAVHQPTVPMVEVRLRIPFAGAEAGHAATAEVLAAAILTGTESRDRVAVDTELALVGGELSAAVDPELLSLGGNALASGFDTLLAVLADALTGATYADDEVAGEKARLIERITVARSKPNVIARQALQRHRYGDHPFTRELPEAADVAKVEPADVRALHQAAVLPRGSVLVLVGDVEPERAIAGAAAALGGWQSEASASVLPALPPVTPGDLLVIDRPGAVQSQIRLSAQSISRTDPRYPALQLANLAFGGFFSSRLVENIREDKGYTYHARSYPEFTPDGATLLIDTDTASDVTAAALLEIRYELGRFALVALEEAEVDIVRQYAIGSLLTSTSSQGGLASQIAALAVLGLGVEWLVGHPDRLKAVTAADVTEAAREFFAPTRFTGVIVGDVSKLAPLDRIGGVRFP
ncbi:M16 family metallopeptidase [Actinokineospora globicatena]|uniref:M16 family metallopeptidase n=1 Tax=Actinokineospora globicatena TaxID=103729 RepID=UPI0020A35B47|nr:pitrilysin family protein [Actinokineospora globicatena]MCP2300371.1 putative Zn-dependent peptidase [Actinokineospora globicatena]GLW80900.1 peptidase M16 [Actinokineospora globicatena]GLW88093.1 peptidase M16 [Actinokineospora globicatena]